MVLQTQKTIKLEPVESAPKYLYTPYGTLKRSLKGKEAPEGGPYRHLIPKGPSNSVSYTLGAKYLLSTYYNGTWTLWVCMCNPKP